MIGIMNPCVWNGVKFVKLDDIEVLVMFGVAKVISAVCLKWDGCFQIRIGIWVSARGWRQIGMGWCVRAHCWRQIQCGMWVRLCAGVKCDVVCGCALIDVVKYDVVCGFAFALASDTVLLTTHIPHLFPSIPLFILKPRFSIKHVLYGNRWENWKNFHGVHLSRKFCSSCDRCVKFWATIKVQG